MRKARVCLARRSPSRTPRLRPVRAKPSGENGDYRFVALPPGTYELNVEMGGFRTAVRENVPLRVDSTTKLDVPLEVGSLAESVQVVGGNAGDQHHRRQHRQRDQRRPDPQLPLEGRNVVGLLACSRASPTSQGRTRARHGSALRLGERRPRRPENVTLDGIDVNDSAEPDRVHVGPARHARFGPGVPRHDQQLRRRSGRSSGAQVSLVTRSGTNAFSGSGYYVNRNTKFSSNEYFLKLSQLAEGRRARRRKLDKNIFGGSLGGPIRKDRLFFFGNFEGLNENRETVGRPRGAVELAARRRADLPVRARRRPARAAAVQRLRAARTPCRPAATA